MSTYKLLYIIIAFFIILNQNHASNSDWGETGHRSVGEIAELYLNGKTKRKIKELLKGESLALVSTYADDIKSDKRFGKFYPWHYVNLPIDENYQSSVKNPKGDLVLAIEKCKSVILDKTSSNDDKIFYLKLLVHFIGDLHQPLHAGLAEDKGGNNFQVQWFGSGTNLHSVWDSKMINHYNMTYTELAKNKTLFSKEQIKTIKEGSTEDWLNETHALTKKVYTSAKKGENLRYEYMYKNFGLVRSQIHKGGIRLAKVLNDIFS